MSRSHQGTGWTERRPGPGETAVWRGDGFMSMDGTGRWMKLQQLFIGQETEPVLRPSQSLRHRVSRGQHH